MVNIHALSSIYTYETERKTFASGGARTCHNLAYQVTGSYDHFFDFGKLSVGENSLFFINKEDVYTVKRLRQGYSISVTFYADIDFQSAVFDCSNDPQVYNLFQKLLRLRNLDIESNRCLATAIVYELFSIIYKKKNRAYVPSTTSGKLTLARDYIHAHYREEQCKAEDLAKICGVGVKRFRELFKQVYKTTPTQYAIDLRLNESIKLLSDGNLSIQTIADAVGFSDAYYFSKLFKKRFGVCPKKFRANN